MTVITTSTTLAELSAGAIVTESGVSFPGARPPDRRRDIDAEGVRIAVHEWGDPDAPPLLLAHGGLDFSRTMDVFAPLLADGGWRVVAWDQRGHGESAWVELGSWAADLRDVVRVLQSIDGPYAGRPMPVIGHSKGGAMSIRLAESLPYRFTKVVNIDGMPSKRSAPDISDTERTRMQVGDPATWLDHRAKLVDRERRAGPLTELAERRARMNPRLTPQWLAYLVSVGARHDADGWRWKTDPMLRPGGFGPWRPEWMVQSLATLPMPFLGFLCSESEPMGWATRPADVEPFLPRLGTVVLVENCGHFIHIERPGLVAARVLEFLS